MAVSFSSFLAQIHINKKNVISFLLSLSHTLWDARSTIFQPHGGIVRTL